MKNMCSGLVVVALVRGAGCLVFILVLGVVDLDVAADVGADVGADVVGVVVIGGADVGVVGVGVGLVGGVLRTCVVRVALVTLVLCRFRLTPSGAICTRAPRQT